MSSALKPGGWLDQAEPSLFFRSDYVPLEETHPYSQWNTKMKEAGEKAGMRFDVAEHLKGWLEEAGFVNVHEYRMPWTIGGWPKNKHQREVGQWNQLRLDIGIKDFCARRFTNQMAVRGDVNAAFGEKILLIPHSGTRKRSRSFVRR